MNTSPVQASAPLRVALLGCGTVGSHVARLLTSRADQLETMIGRPIELAGIAVKSLDEVPDSLPEALFTDDAAALVARGDLDIVIELIGGVDFAGQMVRSAIEHGASVVTANKALLGAHGAELFAQAEAAGVDLYFEAAVAGAIPIIRPLRESLIGDEITLVMGIVNGTTNYILEKMTVDQLDFAEALAQAQRLGFAEADPTADVEGYDAASKAAILASLAFRTWVGADQVGREGITDVTQEDIQAADRAGCVLKLLATAQILTDGAVSVRVHPAMVPKDHPLATVGGPYNAIFLQAREADRLMFLGPGAGGAPTASAVVGDLATVARNRHRGVAGPAHAPTRLLPVAEPGAVVTRYHLRFVVADQPGILASVAAAFAAHNVSVRTVHQSAPEADPEATAQISLMTHLATEADVQACVADLDASPFLRGPVRLLRVEGM